MSIKLDMVGIVVEDMKHTLQFYRTLGFSIAEECNNENHVEIEQGGVRLAFDTKQVAESVFGEWEQAVGHRIELAFLCDSPVAVDETYDQIVENGFTGHRAPWDAFWGQRYAIVQDPNGNLISLFA
ncbi:VOC family protein [Paenibacillus yanchengensis]|uniref:VOC family protein n=1 Tax=Paenibacillus yanchengensis TaxID=2035833 RepID=A0ABW4YP32_9BACL